MSTTFSSLPIVDLAPLGTPSGPTNTELTNLSRQLYDVFATTGFAYLVNTPLSFSHADVFGLALEFFNLSDEEKMKLAKKTFRKENINTYRGYFPTQPKDASDNLKEGFEMGPSQPAETTSSITGSSQFNLSEPNVWPDDDVLPSKQRLEQLYTELQTLSSNLLSLLAMSLGKSSDFFAPYLQESLSTLRLLHYPPISSDRDARPDHGGRTYGSVPASPPPEPEEPVRLSCTPHTDSGILTLLHQDPTGGLEVQDSSGKWVPAPYVPESLVVNIGDLMAKVSGGRFVATMHRVRAPPQRTIALDGDEMSSSKFGRFSVPFFFEPGEKCIVRPVDGNDEAIVYGEHVRAKMMTWVEFRHDVVVEPISSD